MYSIDNLHFFKGAYIWCCPCLNIKDVAEGLEKEGLPYALSTGIGRVAFCCGGSLNSVRNY